MGAHRLILAHLEMAVRVGLSLPTDTSNLSLGYPWSVWVLDIRCTLRRVLRFDLLCVHLQTEGVVVSGGHVRTYTPVPFKI